MDFDNFITIGGQILAKTGTGEYKLIPWPIEQSVKALDPLPFSGKLPAVGETYKRLIEGGGDIVNLKGMSLAEEKAARAAAQRLMPSSMVFNLHREKSEKVARSWKNVVKKVKGILPVVAPWLTKGPIGAGIGSLLYAGTSKKLHAPTLDYQLDRPGNILDTPITATNRNLYDQIGDTSLGFMDRESGFDPIMRSKLNNLRAEGVQRPISNYTAPDRGDWGPGLHLARGGIASLVQNSGGI